MNQIVEVRASLDVTGANDNVVESVTVQPLDENREIVRGVTVTPPSVTITQPVILQGGYRNVVVKVVTNGQVAEGYWLTNVSVTPPNVTVFSTNPQAVNDLPGFVETNPIDLTDLSDDVDIRATLNLPEGVTLAGEESVLVRLSIVALEGSLPINLPVETIGLSPEYRALLSPDTVDLLLVGPLTILNNLTPASIRVSVDLSGLEPGIHQIPVVVDLLPNEVDVAAIIPENVEATIELAPTPTPTSNVPTTPGSELTQTVTPSSTPSP
jgi:YbbR domain-containing protein